MAFTPNPKDLRRSRRLLFQRRVFSTGMHKGSEESIAEILLETEDQESFHLQYVSTNFHTVSGFLEVYGSLFLYSFQLT